MAKNIRLRQYQQAMIDAYYDKRMHDVLDPLYDSFLRWKQDDMSHADLMELLHKAHQENQRIFTFFATSRDLMVRWIPAGEEWFQKWQGNNPPPPDVNP